LIVNRDCSSNILKMLALCLLLGSLLGMVSSSQLELREEVGGGPVFSHISHSGNGCPQGSATTISGNWKTATFRFEEFGFDSEETGRKLGSENCGVHLTGKGAQPGYQVAVTEADLWGDLLLRNGTTFAWFGTQFRSEHAEITVS
jgi:hypothetical protein